MSACANCGAPLADGKRFCTACGAQVQQTAPPAQPTAAMPPVAPAPSSYAPPVAPASAPTSAPQGFAPSPAVAPPAKRSPALVIVIVLVLVGALLSCCGGVGFYLWRSGRIGGAKAGGATTAGGTTTGQTGDPEDGSATETDGESGGATGGSTSGESGSSGASDGPPSTPPTDLTGMATPSASSVLGGSSKADYEPDNLVDGDYETCWAEGVRGYGGGESVTFTFPREVWLAEVHIVPGYLKYDSAKGVDRWYSNGRVKTAKLRFSDGSTSGLFGFDSDLKDWQHMILDRPVRTKSVTVEIVAAHPAQTGTNSDAEDTSVSEMTLTGWAE